MSAQIYSLGTAVPPNKVNQKQLATRLSDSLGFMKQRQEKLQSIFSSTQIFSRYSVLNDYQHPQLKGGLYDEHFPNVLPGTSKRNEIYKKEAPKLAHQAATKALDEWGGDPSDITHVISVSCTGMVAPGIEFHLVDSLGLSRNVHRLGINFMGCFGAFQGLSTAKSFALESLGHRVLLVCTELCSLHLQADQSVKTFVANSLFSDGTAAVVVGAEPRLFERPLWSIRNSHSLAIKGALQDMTWEIGDDGCVMNLSLQVPLQVKRHIKDFIVQLCEDEKKLSNCEWLIHPGGKAILYAVAEACGLDPEVDLRHSWEVLREYGNMSSATFLFVLEAARKNKIHQEWGVGVGFGPGLSLEGVLLKNEA